jgi:hypothetical protein
MIASKSKNSFLLLFLIISSCASTLKPSFYKTGEMKGHRAEIHSSPDRIAIECTKESDEDPGKSYGFTIDILDEEKTIVSVIQTNLLSKEACLDTHKHVSKILKNGKEIYIAGMGVITDPRVKEKWTRYIPGHGTFHTNGRSLQYMFIANEKGQCYGAYTADTKPCPRGNFPIKDHLNLK